MTYIRQAYYTRPLGATGPVALPTLPSLPALPAVPSPIIPTSSASGQAMQTPQPSTAWPCMDADGVAVNCDDPTCMQGSCTPALSFWQKSTMIAGVPDVVVFGGGAVAVYVLMDLLSLPVNKEYRRRKR